MLFRSNGEQTVDVLFDQLHVAGKTRLCLAEDDLEPFLLCRFNHAAEIRTETVCARVIFITIDGVNVPSVVDGVVG